MSLQRLYDLETDDRAPIEAGAHRFLGEDVLVDGVRYLLTLWVYWDNEGLVTDLDWEGLYFDDDNEPRPLVPGPGVLEAVQILVDDYLLFSA